MYEKTISVGKKSVDRDFSLFAVVLLGLNPVSPAGMPTPGMVQLSK